MRSGLEQVEDVVGLVELAGSVAEIDAAVAGDVEVVGEGEGDAVGLGGEGFHLALRIDAQQAFPGVGEDQVAGGIEVHAQRAAAGVDEGLDLAAGVQAYHAAVGETGIDAALAVHGGVLRAVQLALAKQLGLHQGVVGFEDPGHLRSGRSIPGERVDRAGLQGQVKSRASQQEDDYSAELLHAVPLFGLSDKGRSMDIRYAHWQARCRAECSHGARLYIMRRT